VSDHPLSGATLKLQRANANLAALKNAISTEREKYPHRAITDVDEKSGICLIAIDARPPPTFWAPLIGDVLHNIHSSLDHLMWELIRRHNYGGDPSPDTRATFPIFANRSRFWAKETRPGKRRWTSRSGATALLRVPGDARRLILEVQPYKDRHREHPLWHLYWLSNADKHQTLHYVQRAVTRGDLHVVSTHHVEIRSFEPRPGPIPTIPGLNPVIGKMRFEVVGDDPRFTVRPRFTFREAFAEDGPAADLSIIDALNQIMDFAIQDVFAKRFWPYFGAIPDDEITLIREHAKAYAD
jgi:hypothetical protein